jgi:hypothetical protein
VKSGLVGGVAFVGSGLIGRVAFVGSGLINAYVIFSHCYFLHLNRWTICKQNKHFNVFKKYIFHEYTKALYKYIKITQE